MGLVAVEDPATSSGYSRPARAFAVHEVANRPIAHHVIDALASAGVREVVVAASVEQIEEVRACMASLSAAAMRFTYLTQPAPLDLAGAISLAAPAIATSPCIVHVATGLLAEPLVPFVSCIRRDRCDMVLLMHQNAAPDRRLSAATREMLHIAELHPQVAGLGMAGVWLFGPHALSHVARVGWSDGQNAQLTKIAQTIGGEGGTLHVRLTGGWCRYAGDALDLLELNRASLDRLEPDGSRTDSAGNRIEGRVVIDERACVRASVLVGPAVIGARAHISDSYIGPYTSIGAGARVEGAEIERSIVLAGASIAHVGGRLVASVIGEDARVFRDFSLPRALRLRIGAGTEVALS
jgi:glucose-1-phosphate thymidylyltransferase